MTAPPERSPRRVLIVILAVHAVLVLWAARAWIHGPFLGEGILDGHELLELARSGTQGAFRTKSPLYPALLRAAFALLADSPWTVALLGLCASSAVLLAVHTLAVECGEARAAPWAAGLYALSGSSLVFAVQPLPVLCATAFLAWGVVFVLRALRSGSPLHGALAGLLLGASVFTRAPLLIAAGLCLSTLALRGRVRAALAGGAGLAVAAVLAFASFGANAWPTGSMLNLRQGNGAERSGISDLRPGPGYDRVRLEGAFAPAGERGSAPTFERFQRDALAAEVRADPAGAAATLARKAYLFWQRTETVTAADFRHGLARFPLRDLLLCSFGLIAPLALLGLARRACWPLFPALFGIFAVNVVWLTSARYRFPALPLLCVAAGSFVAARPSPRAWGAALLVAIPLNVNLAGIALTVPGDGSVQEGRMWLARERTGARTRAAYEAAFAAGSRDPRAHYERALVREALGTPADLEGALADYERALELAPTYAEAAENLVALLLQRGRTAEAATRAEELTESSPYAGKVWLNLALARRALDPGADVAGLEAQGFLRLALRALAQNDRDAFERWAAEARLRGLDDARLDGP